MHHRLKSPWLIEVINGLKQSIAKNKRYYRTSFYPSNESKNTRQYTHDVTAKIIVIIDSKNFSAALNFIDDLKMMTSNMILVGQPTGADTFYGDVRTAVLPSGTGSFSFPICVYHNCPRLANQPYIPDIEYKDIYNGSSNKFFINFS